MLISSASAIVKASANRNEHHTNRVNSVRKRLDRTIEKAKTDCMTAETLRTPECMNLWDEVEELSSTLEKLNNMR